MGGPSPRSPTETPSRVAERANGLIFNRSMVTLRSSAVERLRSIAGRTTRGRTKKPTTAKTARIPTIHTAARSRRGLERRATAAREGRASFGMTAAGRATSVAAPRAVDDVQDYQLTRDMGTLAAPRGNFWHPDASCSDDSEVGG